MLFRSVGGQECIKAWKIAIGMHGHSGKGISKRATGEMEKSEVMIPVNVRAVHSQVKSRLKSPDFEAVAGKNRKKFGI